MSATTKELVPLKRTGLEISIEPEFVQLRDGLLASASMILDVTNATQYDFAVEILDKLAEIRRGVEKARKEVKEPFVRAGKDIDEKAKEALSNVSSEETRLGRAAGDWKAVLAARERAATVLASRDDISDDERGYLEMIATADTIEDLDKIQAERNAANGSKPSMVQSNAVSICDVDERCKTEWEITITDVHALYRSHPACVDLTPRISMIKQVLDAGAGEVLKGVTAKKVNKVKAAR